MTQWPARKANLSRSSFANDVFSHRLESYNSGDMQYHLAMEDMIRSNVGKVNSYIVTFTRQENNSTFLKDAFSALKTLGIFSQVEDNNGFYCFNTNWIAVLADEKQWNNDLRITVGSRITLTTIQPKLFESLRKELTRRGFLLDNREKKDNSVSVTFAFPGDHGPDLHEREFDRLSFESVKQNYTPEITEQINALIKNIKNTTHGLVLLGGPVGTGKSYLIRALLSEIPRHAVVCSPAGLFLERTGLLNQVLAQYKKSVVVLEDIGSVLEMDAALAITDQRANLLNITEGLLSLLFDSIVIISFNHDPERIDEAVRRPGRCLAYFKVGMLPYKQAQDLVGKDLLLPNRQYSLAEVYEMKRTGEVIPGKSVLGLNR